MPSGNFGARPPDAIQPPAGDTSRRAARPELGRHPHGQSEYTRMSLQRQIALWPCVASLAGRARVVCMIATSGPVATDALLGMLLPFWQLVIGLFVLVVLALSVRRLIGRGRSRMTTALLVSGAAAVAIATIGFLVEGH